MKCLLLGQMSQLESLRALYQCLYFFVIFISDLPEVVHPGKTITFMQSTVNVLESSTLLVILSQQELNYLHQCILALPYSESVEGWVLSTAFYFLHRLLLL